MDIINLSLGLNTSRAEQELRRLDALGNKIFSKQGFKINVSTTGLPLGRITGDFDNFKSSLDAATARVAAFTATTGIVYGLADAFRRLFTESVNLEKQLASIQSILRVSSSELDKLSKDLLAVANGTAQSFDTAVQAATEFSRQGLTLNKTIEATTAALTLSRIAGLDAADSVQSLTAVMNTFVQEGLSYQQVLDTIISLDNNFAASAAGITDGLKRVGSVASEAGLQLREVASLITVVQQVSARGEAVISNGLKTIFTRLGRSNIQDALGEIGIATQTVTGEFRSYIDILTDLANKQDQLTDSQKAFITETVAGGFQINTLQSVLKTLRGEYSLFDRAVGVAGDSAGDTAARLRILNDTASSSLQVLQNNLQRTFANIGDKTVLPLLKDFTQVTNTILESFNSSQFEQAFADIDTRSIGQKFGQGLLDGIAGVITSSGSILISLIIGKLIGNVFKDLAKGVQSLATINGGTLVNRQLQETVNKAILTGNQALVQRLAQTDSLVQKNIILNQLLERQNQIGNLNLTDVLVGRGLRNANIKTKARGFIPAILKEKRDILNGVGGASRKAQPLIREVDLGKGREKVVVNSDELLVKNYLNSGKDAIFNQDMIRDAGGIEALQKMGKVKRFASGSLYDQLKTVYSQEEELYRKNGLQGDFATSQRGKELRTALSRALSGTFDQSSVDSLIKNSPIKQNKQPLQDLSSRNPEATPRSRSSSQSILELNPNGRNDPFESNKPNTGTKLYKNLEKAYKERYETEIEKLKFAQAEAESIRRSEKQAKKLARSQRLGNAALLTSLGAPFLSNAITSAVGADEEGVGGRINRGVEAGASALSIAAFSGFNPLATAAAGLYGAFKFLKSESDTMIPSFEKLKKSADSIIAANQAQLNSVQQVIQGQNVLNELNKNNASLQDRVKARTDIATAASQIQDERVRRVLLSGDSSKAGQDTLDKFQLQLQKSSRAQEAALVARKAVEESQKRRNGIGSLFSGDSTVRENFDVKNFDAFLQPFIDAIDVTALSSQRGAFVLSQLNRGLIDGEKFFQILKEEFGLLASTADVASSEFKNLNDTFSTESVDALKRYLSAQLGYKQSLIDIQKTLAETETVSINFKRAFDVSIKNLLQNFDFESFSQITTARSSLGINKQIFEAQRDLGQISERDLIQRNSAIGQEENQLRFVEQSNKIVQEALSPLVNNLKNNLPADKQGEVVSTLTSLFERKLSFKEAENTLRGLLGNGEESSTLLKDISKSSQEVGSQIAKLELEMSTSNNEIINLEKLQLARLNKGPGIVDITSGKTAEARSKLLNKTVDSALTKQIEDLRKSIAIAGPSTKRGAELTQQLNSVQQRQQRLRQEDLEARRFLTPRTAGNLSAESKKQEVDVLAADFYKTNAELLKQALDEINIVSKRKFGVNKFSQEDIGSLTNLLQGGNATKVFGSLQNRSSSVFNPEIKSLLNNIFSSGILSGFQQDNLEPVKVEVPKTLDLKSLVDGFKASLTNVLPSDFFSKGKESLSGVSSAQEGTKRAADELTDAISQLSKLDSVIEGNRQIIEKNRQSFEKSLGTDLTNRIASGQFTQANLGSISQTKRTIIESTGIKLPQNIRSFVEEAVRERRRNLDEAKSDQTEAEKGSIDALNNLNDTLNRLLEVENSKNVSGDIQTKVEQAISLAVDVRGVDDSLVTDIKTALTSVIDSRIKEIVKDTFNVNAITKPTVQVA